MATITEEFWNNLSDQHKEQFRRVFNGDATFLDYHTGVFEKLYEFYSDWSIHGPDGMPYGTMKARDGDPMEWVEERVWDDFGEFIDAD